MPLMTDAEKNRDMFDELAASRGQAAGLSLGALRGQAQRAQSHAPLPTYPPRQHTVSATRRGSREAERLVGVGPRRSSGAIEVFLGILALAATCLGVWWALFHYPPEMAQMPNWQRGLLGAAVGFTGLAVAFKLLEWLLPLILRLAAVVVGAVGLYALIQAFGG